MNQNIGQSGPEPKDEEIKYMKKEEIQAHNKEKDMWLLMNSQVCDISDYKHPGGYEVLRDYEGGKIDAYKAFIEFGHSAKAHKIMESRLK